MQVLKQGKLNLQLRIDAEQRESPMFTSTYRPPSKTAALTLASTIQAATAPRFLPRDPHGRPRPEELKAQAGLRHGFQGRLHHL